MTLVESALRARVLDLERKRLALEEEQARLDAEIIEVLKKFGETLDESLDSPKRRRRLSEYGRKHLGLASTVARSRATAAVVAIKHPSVPRLVKRRQLTFIALKTMEPYLHIPNLFERFVGKTARQIEALISGSTARSGPVGLSDIAANDQSQVLWEEMMEQAWAFGHDGPIGFVDASGPNFTVPKRRLLKRFLSWTGVIGRAYKREQRQPRT